MNLLKIDLRVNDYPEDPKVAITLVVFSVLMSEGVPICLREDRTQGF